MHASTRATRITRRLFAVAAAATLLLALAAPAVADGGREVSGESFLEGKDTEQQTLQLEDVLIRVTEDTRIYNAASQRISFDKIPGPREGQAIVEYSGRAAGKGQIVASRLVVRQQPN